MTISPHVDAARIAIDIACPWLFTSLSGRSLRLRTELLHVSSARQMAVMDVTHTPVAVVLSLGQDHDVLSRSVGLIRSVNPAVTVFLATDDGTSNHRRFSALAHSGADRVFICRTPSERRHLCDDLEARIDAPAPTAILELVTALKKSAEITGIVTWMLRNTYRLQTVPQAARWFGLKQKDLNARLLSEEYPRASSLLRLGRWFHSQELRRSGALTKEETARRLQFSDATSLQGLSRRLGRKPAELLGLLYIAAVGGEDPHPQVPTTASYQDDPKRQESGEGELAAHSKNGKRSSRTGTLAE